MQVQVDSRSIGDRVADEAFSWVNTPYRHQGRIKGLCVDCANFIYLVALAPSVGLISPEEEIFINNYRRTENGAEMLYVLEKKLVYVDDGTRKRGDILALCDEERREPNVPRHLVITHEIKPHTTYIIDATERGVRRHRMDGRWENRVHSTWRAIGA